jgi:EAL domain-containing protein (putative c-di-GMP-specific phosphodiesterase class I)
VSYRLPIHQRLSHALSNDEFRIYYQPVVSLATDEVVGCEALLRWEQRDSAFASPDTFISQAETSGFIINLGDFVLRGAAEQMRRWHERYGTKFKLAVNLSARQFAHHNLAKSIEDALRFARFPGVHLEFEITETVAMHDAEESIGIMRQLKQLGISLALDDFGTGYSSLSYLKKLPIDKLKIDKSFVRDIPSDENDLAIVTAIIAMAHSLGMTVHAEGVETQAQADFLRDCGCEYAQGFLYARALPAVDFEGYIDASRAGSGSVEAAS